MKNSIQQADAQAISRDLRRSKHITMARVLARVVKTVHPSAEAMARRKRYEKRLADWLKYYLPETYSDPWGEEHKRCINLLESCIRNGGSFALAMPRGSGKSAIGKGACLCAALSGMRRYIVPIGATDALAGEYLEFIKAQLTADNERLMEDYSDVLCFFVALGGKAINANYQLDSKLRKTGIGWRAKGITFPTVYMSDDKTPYPYSGARVECRGITAAMKGMSKTVKKGVIIRPDFVLPDDVQTEEDAESPEACNKIERKITGTVLGLAGPRRRIACFMPCTCVKRGDVSDIFLDRARHPEFQGQRNPMFIKWPDAQETLWKEYAEIRREADNDADGKKKAGAFYKLHRKEMDAGAVVSWTARVRLGELSAIETAENLLLELGEEKFWAEMQNDPKDLVSEAIPYTLSPAIIMGRTDKRRKVWERPEWVTRVIASTDVNPSYAFSTVVMGFGEDQSAVVLWYGLHKLTISGDAPSAVLAKALYESLVRHGKELAGCPVKVEEWAIDGGGGQFDPVIRLAGDAARLCGIPAHGFTGRGAAKYRPWGKTVSGALREECHGCMAKKDGRTIRWVAWNADYWKEAAQRAWLGEIGSPGSVSLYKGSHKEFATQVCADKLMGKGEVGGQMMWNFHRIPGKNDFGDAMAQGYALAAYIGIGTHGKVEMRGGRKKYRQSDLTR
jgi:hypothetical protein